MKSQKTTNIFLWVLQTLLALWNITGGMYMISNFSSLARKWALNIFPGLFWIVLGVLQILFAVGLIVPGILKMHKFTFISAIGLTVISLLGIVLYSGYTGIGILWGLVPAIISGFVAYGRSAR